MNSCTFLGRMVRDPELRATNAAEAVTGFSLAVERGYTAKDGTRPVDFLDFVAYGQRAMFICKYFAKGQLMAVSAKAYQRSWTARDGTQRRSVEFAVQEVYFAGGGQRQQSAAEGAPEGFEALPDTAEALPF